MYLHTHTYTYVLWVPPLLIRKTFRKLTETRREKKISKKKISKFRTIVVYTRIRAILQLYFLFNETIHVYGLFCEIYYKTCTLSTFCKHNMLHKHTKSTDVAGRFLSKSLFLLNTRNKNVIFLRDY